MMFRLTSIPGHRVVLGAFRKDLTVALAMLLLLIPLARSAPPDERTKALIDAAIVQERKGPERIRKLVPKEITRLLMNENFEQLESNINQIEKAAQNDPTLEFEFHVVFENINWMDANLLAPLDRWVKLRPSAIAYTARGAYLGERAFALRGNRMARETPPLNFELMEMSAKRSIQDLQQAISLNPSYTPAYTNLIKVSMISRSGGVDAFQLVSTISRLRPGNMRPRQAFLQTLEPRWGGSHEAMFRFAESAARDARHNPMLWLLTGLVYLDLVRSRHPNVPEQDVKDLTEALKYGETNLLLEARANAYWHLKNYHAAIVDYSKCVENNPNGPHNCKTGLKVLTDFQKKVWNPNQKSN